MTCQIFVYLSRVQLSLSFRMDQNWHQRLNLSLQDEDHRMEALQEIKTYLSAADHNQLHSDACNLELPLIFDCLNTNDTEQVDLACEILTICMENLTIGESTQLISSSLVRSLNHPKPKVRLMALKEIERVIKDEDQIKQVFAQPDLVESLFRCVSNEKLQVATRAADVIATIGKSEMGLTRLLQKPYVDEINQGMQASDIVRFRIYAIVVEIACNNSSSLQAMVNRNWIGALIQELFNPDILLQLNTLELLSNLAATPFGRNYLENQDLLNKLSHHFEGDDQVLSSLLLPGLVRFFGNVAYWDSARIFKSYPIFPKTIFNIKNLEDPTLFVVTVDTIGHIGSTVGGKKTLNGYDTNMKQVLRFLNRFLINIPSDAQARVLTCFENLIRIPPGGATSEISRITEKWYQCMVEGSDVILKYAKIPFPETRIPSYNCLEAMAEQDWGEKVILQTPGLVEFLLDRSQENTKEGKDVIYTIIKCLASSDSVIDNHKRDMLEKYVRDGAYFSGTRVEVAVEGNAPN